MQSIADDVRVLLRNFDRDQDPGPLVNISDILDQMPADIAESEEILELRVLVEYYLQRWLKSRDHLAKLIEMNPSDPNRHRDLASLNFRIREFADVVDGLRRYFRLPCDRSATIPYHLMSTALHALGRGGEANEFLDDAVRANPALAIYRDEKFLDFQQAARERGLPAVFLNTLFKSASMYIATRLAVGLKLPRCYITQAVLSGETIIPSWLELFAKGGAICQEHLPARAELLAALAGAGIERIVVHTRDPRQAMVSAIHHYAGMFSEGTFEADVFIRRLPQDYCQRDFAGQAGYYLEHHFEHEARWVADWRTAVTEGLFSGRILLTSYEQFRRGERAYFEALLDFYDIPSGSFEWSQIEAGPKKGKLHYRSGETNEWERVLSESQISRANQIMAAAGLDPDSFAA